MDHSAGVESRLTGICWANTRPTMDRDHGGNGERVLGMLDRTVTEPQFDSGNGYLGPEWPFAIGSLPDIFEQRLQ